MVEEDTQQNQPKCNQLLNVACTHSKKIATRNGIVAIAADARRNKNEMPKTVCTIKQNYGINKTIHDEFQCTNLLMALLWGKKQRAEYVHNSTLK